MARIYAGELQRLDRDVVRKLRGLPDDFRVLAEVSVGRNVDFIVIRPGQSGPSVMIAAELKRVARPLYGQADGPWRALRADGSWEELRPSNQDDLNYFHQAVHAANALQHWLWTNQRLYREGAQTFDMAYFSVWPDLVLLSPAGVLHRLPLQPTNRFGQWWFDLDAWVRHVERWIPKKGPTLSHGDVERLIATLGLCEVRDGDNDDAGHDDDLDGGLADGNIPSVIRRLARRIEVLEAALAVRA